MKQNKNRIINLRITESEFEAVHRLSKHYRRSIADLLRGYINTEELKLLRDQQSQETIFSKSDIELTTEANRQLLATLNLLSLSNHNPGEKRVARLKRGIGKAKKVASPGKYKVVTKRNKGIEKNE